MSKRFTITINDERNGIKQYNVHQVIKKIALYFALFLVGVIAIGAFSIYYLTESVDTLNAQRADAKQALMNIEKKNRGLVFEMQQKESLLQKKKDEIASVTDQLTDIEELIGLAPAKEHDINERLEIAKLNSTQISYMLKFIPNGWPIAKSNVTSRFGYRIHPTLRRKEFHRGVDLRAKMKTPVYATADGIVEYAAYHKSSGFGNLVIIDHGYGFKTNFAHLNKVAVKAGQYVKKGDLVAYTGNSGMSNGPHLHYEIRFIQRALNPVHFMSWNVNNYQTIFQKEKRVSWQSLITVLTHQIQTLKQQ